MKKSKLTAALMGNGNLPAMDMKGVIPAETVVRGDMEFSGGLWVDGNIHGHLHGREAGSSTVVINHQGSVHGNITADHLVVYGQVSGNIQAGKTLHIGSSAKITGGDIRYRQLSIAEGAVIDGQLFYLDQAAGESQQGPGNENTLSIRSAG